MSKRLLKIGSVIALLLVVAVIRNAMAPAIDWQVFEQRLPEIFEASNINLLRVVTEGPEEVPLPPGQKLRSLFSWPGSGLHIGLGASESVSHWTLKCIGGPVLEILARYHEGNAVCMVIRSISSAEKEKRALRDAIAKSFPSLKNHLGRYLPAPWVRGTFLKTGRLKTGTAKHAWLGTPVLEVAVCKDQG